MQLLLSIPATRTQQFHIWTFGYISPRCGNRRALWSGFYILFLFAYGKKIAAFASPPCVTPMSWWVKERKGD